jgi:hypothetical protein
LNDRKVKLIEIAETLKISKKCVGHIVHEYLDMQKMCAKWVPHVLTIDYLEKGQNINSEYYMALLERLNDEIKKKTAPFEEKKCCFINALCHKSIKTTAILHESGYELLLHSSYSPNLALFFLFAGLKSMVAGTIMNNKTEFYQKKCVLLCLPTNLSAHLYG